MIMVACIVPVCPMRKEAAHRSEMVSQLLFGEYAELLETTDSFSKLRGCRDGYEGWCQNGQITIAEGIADEVFHPKLTPDWSATIVFNGQPMQIPMGANLSAMKDGKGSIGKFDFSFTGNLIDPAKNYFSPKALRSLAMQFLNTSYLWGGRSVFGIDCSGYVQLLFLFFNKGLPRDAYQQAMLGEVVGFLQEAVCGDLAYFDNAEGHITHVGLLLDPETIIHASGRVRIDRIDTQGILNGDTGERTHTLRIIKRYW